MLNTPNETNRAWLSIWVVVHFFILIVCLIHNSGSSLLINRLNQLFTPYSILLAQDYGAKQFALSSGLPKAFPHKLQCHPIAAGADEWEAIEPEAFPVLASIDQRWSNVQGMLALAAFEDNEELIYVVFDHVARPRAANIDAVRLVRSATLSFAQNEMLREGKLPAEDLREVVLYEARVVTMSDSQVKLLPVLEPTRRAASVKGNP